MKQDIVGVPTNICKAFTRLSKESCRVERLSQVLCRNYKCMKCPQILDTDTDARSLNLARSRPRPKPLSTIPSRPWKGGGSQIQNMGQGIEAYFETTKLTRATCWCCGCCYEFAVMVLCPCCRYLYALSSLRRLLG